MLTEAQEDQIIEAVHASRIKNRLLKEDLIDHLCCLTDMHINKGEDFEEALKKAFNQTAPNGLDEIQKETIFLLNYSKIMFMKRLMYVVGYLFTVTWVAGIAFKLLHMPGAGVLLGVGALGLAFIFIPMFLINRYKNFAREVLSERLKWIFGGVSFLLLVTSITMKFLHLMGAGLMLGLSFLVFGIGFLPFLFFRMYKKSVQEL